MAKINFQHLLTVFAVLHGSQTPLITQEVTRQAGVSANRSLKQLDGYGFVDKTKRGRYTEWSLTQTARQTGRKALSALEQQAQQAP